MTHNNLLRDAETSFESGGQRKLGPCLRCQTPRDAGAAGRRGAVRKWAPGVVCDVDHEPRMSQRRPRGDQDRLDACRPAAAAPCSYSSTSPPDLRGADAGPYHGLCGRACRTSSAVPDASCGVDRAGPALARKGFSTGTSSCLIFVSGMMRGVGCSRAPSPDIYRRSLGSCTVSLPRLARVGTPSRSRLGPVLKPLQR